MFWPTAKSWLRKLESATPSNLTPILVGGHGPLPILRLIPSHVPRVLCWASASHQIPESGGPQHRFRAGPHRLGVLGRGGTVHNYFPALTYDPVRENKKVNACMFESDLHFGGHFPQRAPLSGKPGNLVISRENK